MKWKNIRKSQITKTDPRTQNLDTLYQLQEFNLLKKKKTPPQRKCQAPMASLMVYQKYK